MGPPDAKGDSDGDKPSITYFIPKEGTGDSTAVLICPGGGYGYLAITYEGYDVAKWLNGLGITGVVLKYRYANSGAGYKHPVPLHDAQRAMSQLRSKAAELKINPDKIGVLGFSAGGHLAASLGTHFYFGDENAADPMKRISCKPDFMILIYRVITMDTPYTHMGSRINLLGQDPGQKLVDYMSNEKQVTKETPPTFIVQAVDDKVVPVENSLMFYTALRKAGVPVEMHLYLQGDHGFGLGINKGEVSTWPELCKNWMQTLHIIK